MAGDVTATLPSELPPEEAETEDEASGDDAVEPAGYGDWKEDESVTEFLL